MEKEMLKNKVAIITGASYGMGQTMAELFVEEGASVVLTARGQEKLDADGDGYQSGRSHAVAPGATVTPAHLANKAGEQPGGAKMLGYSGHFVYFPGPECDPMDQAYACLYLASKMGRAVRGQVIQVCNGAFL